jgi:hypothetical protein
MADMPGRIDGWWDDSTEDDSRCDFQSLGPPPSLWQPGGATSTAQEISVLDNAFVLIEGHPQPKSGPQAFKDRPRLLNCAGVMWTLARRLSRRGSSSY